MDELFAALEQAFADYRQDLEGFQRKSKPTDGLLGFGRTLGDDPCNERLDERIRQTVEALCVLQPSPGEAERAIRLLLFDQGTKAWPTEAQWMLRAVERHALPLIPYLEKERSALLCQEYGKRYRPWDRLPVQKQVYKALKAKVI